VRTALATLPWVEPSSIETEVDSREVRFNLTDKSAWSEEAARKALKEQRFPEVSVITAPK
jgi:hypothetical protein